MAAGRRDALVTFQRATVTQNALGEEVEAWAGLGDEWAALFYGRGSERREAAAEQASQTVTVQVLSNPVTRGVVPKDRIVLAGNWDIVGVSPDTPKRGHIEFTAVRVL